MARVHIRSLGSQSTRLLVLFALAASLLTVGLLSVRAQSDEQTAVTALETAKPASTTTLVVEGAGSRSVSHDGTVGRFTVSVLRPSVLEAVSVGNVAVTAIRDSVAENCTPGEENADHTAPPTCISPNGLQTTSINIHEEYDWTEEGRVSNGFRYENRLSLALRGTGFAGGLVDLVIKAGGDVVRFDGLSFTPSRRAETQKLALLDAIDDAQETADLMVDHMGYEIVRIVEITQPGEVAGFRAYEFEAEQAAMADDGGFVPTPVFGGSEPVTEIVRIVFEIRPLPAQEE